MCTRKLIVFRIATFGSNLNTHYQENDKGHAVIYGTYKCGIKLTEKEGYI